MAVKNLALKFSGEKIMVGETEYVAAPLPIGKMKLMTDAFDTDKVSESEIFDNMIYFIHASIARNHPLITIEEIEDNMTIGEASDLFQKVIILSGATNKPTEKKMMK